MTVVSSFDLTAAAHGWLADGRLTNWSARTLGDREWWMERLRCYLEESEVRFDITGLRGFFAAIQSGSDAYARRPLKPASVKHAHVTVKAFSNWCVTEGLLSENPMARIPSPKCAITRIEPFTDDELVRLLCAATTSLNRRRDTAVVSVLADTALRASELAGPRYRDLNLEAQTLRVVCGKGGTARTVAFGQSTREAISHYLLHQTFDLDDLLFLSERGGPLDRHALRKLCERLGVAAGVDNVHPHRFRHDCAIRLLRRGAHVFAVMAQLGHERVSTTQIYVQVAEQDVRAMAAVSSPMDGLTSNASR